jgi:hypothetical protein
VIFRGPTLITGFGSPLVPWLGARGGTPGPPVPHPGRPRPLLTLGSPLIVWGFNARFGPVVVPAAPALSFREAIYAYLASLPALTAIVGDRIYISNADRNADYPHFTFEIPYSRGMHGRTYGRNLGGPDGLSTAHVKFTATGYIESDLVHAVQAVAGLDNFTGTLSGIAILSSQIEFEWDQSTAPIGADDRWVHEVTAEYRIVHRATPGSS